MTEIEFHVPGECSLSLNQREEIIWIKKWMEHQETGGRVMDTYRYVGNSNSECWMA